MFNDKLFFKNSNKILFLYNTLKNAYYICINNNKILLNNIKLLKIINYKNVTEIKFNILKKNKSYFFNKAEIKNTLYKKENDFALLLRISGLEFDILNSNSLKNDQILLKLGYTKPIIYTFKNNFKIFLRKGKLTNTHILIFGKNFTKISNETIYLKKLKKKNNYTGKGLYLKYETLNIKTVKKK